MSGLDENGFTTETFEDIRSGMQDDLDVQFGASNASRLTASVLGILVAIVALLAAKLWQLALLVYNSQSPSGSFGVLLDRVLELTGVQRLGQSQSTVACVAVGTNGTVLTAGRRAKNIVTGTYWDSAASATIATVAAWVGSTAYAAGALVANSGSVFYCTTGGTSAGSGGPTGTGTAITDGSCVWRYIAAGSAAVVVPFASEDFGQIVGAAGDITSIESPQGGWDVIVNPLDAAQGRTTESDAAVRIRRIELIQSTGNAALDAIIGDVAKVSGVTRVICFHNDSDATDSDGVPPHAVEVLVLGGADADIGKALLGTVAAGIQTHGTTLVSVVDSQGKTQTLYFSRPTQESAYLAVSVTIDAATFPSDGDAQIKQALVDFSNGLPVGGYTFGYGRIDVGDSLVRNDLFAPIKQISGVTKVSNIQLDFVPSPTATADLTVTSRQQIALDTSRVSVTHV